MNGWLSKKEMDVCARERERERASAEAAEVGEREKDVCMGFGSFTSCFHS